MKIKPVLQKYKPYLSLICGRLYYKLAFLALTIVLSRVWEKADYGYYASKVGTWAVVDTLISIGMGISVPKLLVVYKSIREVLIREAIVISILISLAALISISAIGLILSYTLQVDFDILDIAIICLSLTYGISVVLQCAYRVLGKISYDYMVSYISGSFIIVLALISFFFNMSPMVSVVSRILFFGLTNAYLIIKILKLYPLKKKYNRKFRDSRAVNALS